MLLEIRGVFGGWALYFKMSTLFRCSILAGAARNGKESMRKVFDKMSDIEEATGETAVAIRALEELSSQVGQIDDVIGWMAEQTHVRSLNAAIETATAGKNAGFAVVARELHELAEQSRQNATRISTLVEKVKGAIANTAHAVHDSSKKVANGTEAAESAGAAFQNVMFATVLRRGKTSHESWKVGRRPGEVSCRYGKSI